MKQAILAAFGLTLLALPAQAQPADPSGTYLSESRETQVRIAKCGAAYCGTIISVQGEAKDVNNPDPKLKERNLVGVQMISDIRPAGEGFSGQLYNYKDGKTYNGKMSFEGKAMKLSGCVFGGLICRSQTWTKMN
ncbi:uncharacterized protein (DUF2147 family) [Microvirga flocculans]|uniref:Uncharacterized protein (DUF2147 family) n=1 Tax=Microvirga flocculans TaxID=217168 RepID=A0A7W6N700_9HYPH|nr:DUF2147 domain-containing protein [Microvirga flocculans]MBB4039598.1 uncharacterized protein (DUF2147 family) [Microvirga flocculans]